MRILTLNSGSSSLKFALFETSRSLIARSEETCHLRGLIERIGSSPSFARTKTGDRNFSARRPIDAPNHRRAIETAIALISEVAPGPIDAIGHRVVHGGPKLGRSCLIDSDIVSEVEEACELAPLHNPHNLSGITAAIQLLGDVPNVAAFDTGFHRTIPAAASIYAIPEDLATRHAIHKYGFHGLSHRFVLHRLERLLGRSRKELRVISCHLGNGCSITAIDEGRSVETSMGFTPCEGLIMGTRSGDIDAGALLYLMRKESLSIAEAETLINRRSGFLGISRASNDFREVLAKRATGSEAAELAIDAFIHRLRKYLGAYAAVLGRVDAVAFTGGIGEHVPEVRQRALAGLAGWGIEIDQGRNETLAGGDGRISTDRSPASVWVVPTDEELVIARDTARCVEDANWILSREDTGPALAGELVHA